MAKRLLVVVGPTAIGKTGVAIQLANYYKCDILSSDSRQFYKEMKIGTAVPSQEELSAATHHFIQHRSIHEATYSVGDYEADAIQLLHAIYKENDTAILVGGSGLYLDAVTKGLDYFPDVTNDIKEEVAFLLKHKGKEYIRELLKEKDPAYSQQVDLYNTQRVLRALEVTLSSGKPYSSFVTGRSKKREFDPIFIGLTASREIVYRRINERVDTMIKEGLVAEAFELLPYRNLNALNTVGYKEIFKYLQNEWDLPLAISEIKKNTRRFAKRQGTWFRKNERIKWFDYALDTKEIITYIDTL